MVCTGAAQHPLYVLHRWVCRQPMSGASRALLGTCSASFWSRAADVNPQGSFFHMETSPCVSTEAGEAGGDREQPRQAGSGSHDAFLPRLLLPCFCFSMFTGELCVAHFRFWLLPA